MNDYGQLRKILVIAILISGILLFGPSIEAWAQCPMCRIGAETNLARGGTAGAGLNKGILLLLGLPYILVGTLGYIWWKNRPREERE